METIGQRSIYTQELVSLFKEVPVGDVVRYEAMERCIGIGCRPNEPGYGYQASARKIMQQEYNAVFENLRKVGYRRLPHGDVAGSAVGVYTKKKASLLKAARRRLNTVNDAYETLSPEAKMQTTFARTLLAFEAETNKKRRIEQIAASVGASGRLLGFEETLQLFGAKQRRDGV